MPDEGRWLSRLAACYGQLGQTENAKTEVVAILKAKPDYTMQAFMDRVVFCWNDQKTGNRRAAEKFPECSPLAASES